MEMYSAIHILFIFSLIFISSLIGIKLKKSDKILKNSLILLFALEIFRVVFLLITHRFSLYSSLSLQLCFTYAFIGIIYLITKKKFILDYLGPFGILFALFAIVLTNSHNFFAFKVIDCYLYHSVLLFIGVYITKNYKPAFSYKGILIFWIQILFAFLANLIIKHGANYIFLNTFLYPNHHLIYRVNINAFNMPVIDGISVNDILIGMIHSIGYIKYGLILIAFVTLFLIFWLRIFSKKKILRK